jgi:hypothetical protein
VENICEEDVAPVEKSLYADQACDTVRTLVAVFKPHAATLSSQLGKEAQKYLTTGIYGTVLRTSVGIGSGSATFSRIRIRKISFQIHNTADYIPYPSVCI